MKARLITFLTSVLLFTSLSISSQNDLRIMTYNIRNGIGMDMKSDYKRTANVISKYHPDIVAVQEVDSVTNRSNKRFVLGELSELTGMYYYYAPAIDYDGGKYGTGLLSKEKPIHTSYTALPGREEQRVLLIAEFDKFVFLGVHLSLTEEDQIKSIEIIKQELAKLKKPVFVAGDFNAHPDSEVIGQLKKSFKVLSSSDNTFPADKPSECIDYIALDKRTYKSRLFRNSFVVDEPESSDHRPVLVDVKLP
ncbi:endonuclease/exonuclease/phosphatase family protein [Dysgonomonas sp. HGC4]|uniref:endonuclease/exonuclease/phosphatase family protein n=1 Tax=Dysgonomonas sp. HGC4 TaxID=1658009 RepID=UPI0006821AD2|nr:endonuclease/exonuclease/phosphatase family protein [Dysgonomonas sp. HGC4]MBD8348087.1 endonuclease/exonuclease/phosphatase family protein [Dysgonomonas sp. HGC4]